MASLALPASISVLMRLPLPSIASTVNVGIQPPTNQLKPARRGWKPPSPGHNPPWSKFYPAHRGDSRILPGAHSLFHPSPSGRPCAQGTPTVAFPGIGTKDVDGRSLRREQGFADNFLDRRVAVEDAQKAGFAQRSHALLPRDVAQLLGGGLLHDQFLDPVGQEHHLENRHAALVARIVAGRAALAEAEFLSAHVVGRE